MAVGAGVGGSVLSSLLATVLVVLSVAVYATRTLGVW